eukprot:8169151-Pyramimonas_sp.AAC.1
MTRTGRRGGAGKATEICKRMEEDLGEDVQGPGGRSGRRSGRRSGGDLRGSRGRSGRRSRRRSARVWKEIWVKIWVKICKGLEEDPGDGLQRSGGRSG